MAAAKAKAEVKAQAEAEVQVKAEAEVSTSPPHIEHLRAPPWQIRSSTPIGPYLGFPEPD